jgi:hypothetical protein
VNCANAPDDLPAIVVNARPLRDVVDEAFGELLAANDPPEVFIRRAALVRVRVDERERPRIEALTEPMLRNRLSRIVNFVRTREAADIHVNPPAAVVSDLLAAKTWPGLPPLEGVTEVPVLRADGSIADVPGYDPATRLIYLPPPQTVVLRIPVSPTGEEVVRARALVLELLRDFPFTSSASVANTVALLLTPLVRPAITGAVPMALIDKPKRGTGASLLAQTVQLVATGTMTDLTTAPHEDEEWRKKITAALAAGRTILFFDNVEHTLSSASLAAALTAPEWTDRLLGHSEMIATPNRATWIATGNNLKVGGDLARRCYWIRLDAGVARPWQRDGFRHENLLAYVRLNRGHILGALLTLVRHWFAEGCPRAPVPKVGGFEEWATTVGGTLVTAGFEGFLGNLNELYEQVDEDETAWTAFLAAWTARYGEKAVTVAELAKVLREGDSLRSALPDDLAEALALDAKGKVSFVRRLGKALSKRAGAVFDTLKLEKQKDVARNTATWVVRPTAPPPGFAGFPGFPPVDVSREAEEPIFNPTRTNPGNPGNPEGIDGDARTQRGAS